jgi:hypothetical protein
MESKQIYVYMCVCACVYVLSLALPPSMPPSHSLSKKQDEAALSGSRCVGYATGPLSESRCVGYAAATYISFSFFLASVQEKQTTHAHIHTRTRTHTHTHTVGRDAVSAELMLAKRPSKPANCKLIGKVAIYELFFFAFCALSVG